jgi:hypothetical protein
MGPLVAVGSYFERASGARPRIGSPNARHSGVWQRRDEAARGREGLPRARRDGSWAGSTRFEHPVEMLDTDAMIGR